MVLFPKSSRLTKNLMHIIHTTFRLYCDHSQSQYHSNADRTAVSADGIAGVLSLILGHLLQPAERYFSVMSHSASHSVVERLTDKAGFTVNFELIGIINDSRQCHPLKLIFFPAHFYFSSHYPIFAPIYPEKTITKSVFPIFDKFLEF